ncbi:MAG: hypothetical protein R3C14_44440 [Caldilineaceae bacterium]
MANDARLTQQQTQARNEVRALRTLLQHLENPLPLLLDDLHGAEALLGLLEIDLPLVDFTPLAALSAAPMTGEVQPAANPNARRPGRSGASQAQPNAPLLGSAQSDFMATAQQRRAAPTAHTPHREASAPELQRGAQVSSAPIFSLRRSPHVGAVGGDKAVSPDMGKGQTSMPSATVGQARTSPAPSTGGTGAAPATPTSLLRALTDDLWAANQSEADDATLPTAKVTVPSTPPVAASEATLTATASAMPAAQPNLTDHGARPSAAPPVTNSGQNVQQTLTLIDTLTRQWLAPAAADEAPVVTQRTAIPARDNSATQRGALVQSEASAMTLPRENGQVGSFIEATPARAAIPGLHFAHQLSTPGATPPGLDAQALAQLINDVLVEEATRHGVDLS